MKKIKRILIFILVFGLFGLITAKGFSSKMHITYYRTIVKEDNVTSDEELYTITSEEEDLSTESDSTLEESTAKEIDDVNVNASLKDKVNFQTGDVLNILLIICGSLLLLVSGILLFLYKTKKKKNQ